MNFETVLAVNQPEVAAMLGFKNQAINAQTEEMLAGVALQLQAAVTPRWVYRQFGLQGTQLVGTGVKLPGNDIAAHLAGCSACILLAVTLGTGVEQMIRAAGAGAMSQAVLLDMSASV
ncbi:hypothetical protein LJC61_09730, partial [Ruminococcaceae bacterium OttesenSCG-928-A16]|nr:hypothetical protein [Ruminococcaceae bacterium OttesenSCG-928-A16]